MSHPETVVYLEHDGKVLLVDSSGNGPKKPVKGRLECSEILRFPTPNEVSQTGIDYETKMDIRIVFGNQVVKVIKAYPKVTWPEDWAWKDSLISDNSVHPVAREAIYRSIHRLVSKVVIKNSSGQILMAKAKRGHFSGFWTLPGGYMDHDEHPTTGCVRETLEELGIEILLDDKPPVVTQQIFNDEGISFVSFTYQSTWDGEISEMNLLTEEISEAKWFTREQAMENSVSYFDTEAIKNYR
tara:strand:- start:113 stop:835 length:723 start_codon:yes stop_codon:yes gene_type:complete